MASWEFIATTVFNIALAVLLGVQRARHRKYREAVHALIDEDGYAEGESQALIEEFVKSRKFVGVDTSKEAIEFAEWINSRPMYRNAVAHEVLHGIYLATQRKKS